jgi:hypothetical protein
MEPMDFYGLWLVLWFLFSVLIGYAAKARGRDGLTWFLLALVLSPLIGLIGLLVVPDKRREALQKAPADEAREEPAQSTPTPPSTGSDAEVLPAPAPDRQVVLIDDVPGAIRRAAASILGRR